MLGHAGIVMIKMSLYIYGTHTWRTDMTRITKMVIILTKTLGGVSWTLGGVSEFLTVIGPGPCSHMTLIGGGEVNIGPRHEVPCSAWCPVKINSLWYRCNIWRHLSRPSLVQAKACHRTDAKPLPEPTCCSVVNWTVRNYLNEILFKHGNYH